MAAEITLQAKLAASKSFLSLSKSITVTPTLSGTKFASGAPSIGFAAHEAIVMQDVSSAGCFWVRNLDATNFVQIGVDNGGTFYPFLKLLPGEVACGRLGTNAPYAKADTAAVVLEYLILEV